MIEPGYSYSLEPYQPDAIGTITFTSSAGTRVRNYLIPLPGTLDRAKFNAYNLNLQAIPNPSKVGGDPLPSGNVRIALYRRVGPQSLAGATVNFELVANTSSVSPVVFPAPLTLTAPTFTEVDLLGGQFFIYVRLEDTTASGGAFIIFTLDGATASDTNVEYAWFTTTGAAGAVPSTINGNICTNTADMPWVGVCWK